MAASRQHRRCFNSYGRSQTSFAPPADFVFTSGIRKTAHALLVQLRCTKANKGIGHDRRQAADIADKSNLDGGWENFCLSSASAQYVSPLSHPFASLTPGQVASRRLDPKGKIFPKRPLYKQRCLQSRRRSRQLTGCQKLIKERQQQNQRKFSARIKRQMARRQLTQHAP
jgi:hypothetical protein